MRTPIHDIEQELKPMTPLSELDRGILDLESQFWKYAGAKETAIREQLDMSGTRYYQRLNVLLTMQAAAEYAPTTVNRLRRTIARLNRAERQRHQMPA